MILAGDYIPKLKSVRLDLPFSGTILANLESPVVGDAALKPLPKAGPNLKSRSLGTEQTNFIFCLANNHMMDYGVDGLHLTQDLLCEKSIPFVGVGDDLAASRRPIIVEEAGKRIGILGCCERQFGCSDIGRAGCAGKGFWLLEAVHELKEKCDFVIVSCHIAFEHSPLPSPRVREFYKLLIGAGADVIHGHHAHVPQGWEPYKTGVIFYGLGNFVVDPECWKETNHRWSIVADIDFSGPHVAWKTNVVGVGLNQNTIDVSSLAGDLREYADKYLECWNGVLEDSGRYLGFWQQICISLYDRLYGILLKTPRYAETRSLTLRNRLRYLYDGGMTVLSGLLGRPMGTSRLYADGRALLNFAQCESHQDVLTTALGVANGIMADCRTDDMKSTLKTFRFA